MAINLIDLTGGQRGSVISARDPNLAARRQELERLLAQSLKAPAIQSGGELAARLGTAGLRRFALDRERTEEEERRAGALKTLAEAISPATETIPGAAIGSDIGSQKIVPDQTRERPKTIQELVDVLTGNPDTAEFGFKLGIQDTLKRRQLELKPETFGALVEAMTAEGQPTFIRPGSKGSVSGVEGFRPIPKERKAPKTRRRIQGGTVIQEQFDPVTGEFTEIGRGSRFKPGGGITPAQQANNVEIDAARRELAASGMTREEILKRAQKATETGFDNPDFDPFIGRLVRAATQRKIGDDPGFEQFYRRVYGTSPSAPDEEFRRVLEGATGGPSSAGQPPAGAGPGRAAPKFKIGGTVTIQGKSFEVLKINPDGTVTILDVATGRSFIAKPE